MRYLCLQLSLSLVLLLAAMAAEARAAIVSLQNATATFSQLGWAVGLAIDETYDGNLGWAVAKPTLSGWVTDAETAVFEAVSDVGYSGGTALTFSLHQLHNYPSHLLGLFRLSATTANRSTFADGLSTEGDVTPDTGWTVLTPSSANSLNGATLSVLPDGSILSGGSVPVIDIYTITANTLLTGITGFRLEALTDPSLPNDGPGYSNHGNFVVSEFVVTAAPAAVPEPSSLVVMGGLFSTVGIGMWWRRRGSKKAV